MARECFGPVLVFAHIIDNGLCPSSFDPPLDGNSPIFETHVANDLMAISFPDTMDAYDYLPQATNFYYHLSW
jgi:hypothetical protein